MVNFWSQYWTSLFIFRTSDAWHERCFVRVSFCGVISAANKHSMSVRKINFVTLWRQIRKDGALVQTASDVCLISHSRRQVHELWPIDRRMRARVTQVATVLCAYYRFKIKFLIFKWAIPVVFPITSNK
jgi:hypothetical protein